MSEPRDHPLDVRKSTPYCHEWKARRSPTGGLSCTSQRRLASNLHQAEEPTFDFATTARLQ